MNDRWLCLACITGGVWRCAMPYYVAAKQFLAPAANSQQTVAAQKGDEGEMVVTGVPNDNASKLCELSWELGHGLFRWSLSRHERTRQVGVPTSANAHWLTEHTRCTLACPPQALLGRILDRYQHHDISNLRTAQDWINCHEEQSRPLM